MNIVVEGYRYDTDKLTEISVEQTPISTGVTRKHVWLTPGGKVIVETYSCWEDRDTHGCIGTCYHLAEAEEIALLAERLGDERLMALVPEGE